MFDVSIAVPGMPFDGNTLQERSLGGSESAGLYMAKALQRQGARVLVFCNTPTPMTDDEGVHYHPLSAWGMYARATPHDVAIVQRAPAMFAAKLPTRLNILWCHDLALGRQKKEFVSTLWNVDQVFVLSHFMAEQYKTVYGLPDKLLYRTRNGVDLASFAPQEGVRARKRLIYAARPERGLDVLLRDIMPQLHAVDPDITLAIAGYDNDVPQWREFYVRCRQYANALGAGRVEWLGALTKAQLYAEYARASCYVYPTPSPALPEFDEISCISAMECQAAGLPIVTSARGALSETVCAEAGVLVEQPSGVCDADYTRRFVEATLHVLESSARAQAMSEAGRAHAREHLAWSGVAECWLNHIEESIRANNNDGKRLFFHLWRQSDIIAAEKLLAQEGAIDSSQHRAMLDPFQFAFDGPDAIRTQYSKIGMTHDESIFPSIAHESRLHAMVAWLREKKAAGKINGPVLDYGCGLGGYACFGSLGTGLRFVGMDIDEATIDIARRKTREHGGNASFYVGTHDALPAGEFDCVIAQEVLEHVPEPWRVVEALEQRVTRGGYVYITVPYGPWEYSSYYTYPHRCHIWHFDMHDLRDMFGAKAELSIDSLAYGESPELGDALGWWIVSYRADGKPISSIDVQRKLWLQRPQQTVSANIIAGPGSEETLHWCLRSLQHVADEVLVADCGMSDEARRIVAGYERAFPQLAVFPGSSPVATGFETPRNECLARAQHDWVLWIDTDEKLIGGKELHKYLRENLFDGYGIRQHHFACDTAFTPDVPVRLFRNREYAPGQRVRFYGMLHEHPERALNEGPGTVIIISDVHIAHVGYLIEQGRQRRFIRNYPLLKLDQERYPERLLQKHFIMRDTMILVRNALQANGGQVDDAIRMKCRDVVRLCQQYFLGKGHYMNSDSLQYYSEALSVLGEGFDVTFGINADKVQVNGSGGDVLHYRFACREDLDKEIARRTQEKTALFEDRYY